MDGWFFSMLGKGQTQILPPFIIENWDYNRKKEEKVKAVKTGNDLV